MSRADCDELKERLAEIVETLPEGTANPPEGAVPATERARLLEHASLCPECGELLRSYRALLQGLKGLDRVRAPADLLDRVWKQIDAEGATAPAGGADGAPAERIAAVGPARFRRLAVGLAATLLLGLGLGLYLRFAFPGKPVIEMAQSIPSGTESSSAEGMELARADSIRSVQPATEEEQLTVAAAAPQKPGDAGGDLGRMAGPLDLASAFGSTGKNRLEDLGVPAPGGRMPEPREEADRDSLRSREEPQKFVVRLPQGSRERLDSLISLASAVAAPASLGTSDLGDRKKLITFEVEAARLPDLEASLLGFQGAKRFSEEALAGLKSDFVFEKETAPAPPGPPKGTSARGGGGLMSPPSAEKGFRMRGAVSSPPVPPEGAAAPSPPVPPEGAAASSPPVPPEGAAASSPEASSRPAPPGGPAPGKLEDSRPSPAPEARAAGRRLQTPARPESPRSATSPVPPAATPPPAPSSPSVRFSDDEIAQGRAAKDSAPLAEREYFQASAAEGKQVPEADRFGALKKLKLGQALAPRENAAAPASPRVRVEILVEMD